jgi:hypothetical protein
MVKGNKPKNKCLPPLWKILRDREWKNPWDTIPFQEKRVMSRIFPCPSDLPVTASAIAHAVTY